MMLPTPMAALALLSTLAVSTPASAQRVMHRVRFGESLADISQGYYGDKKHAQVLRVVNGFGPRRKLQAGERIRIPTTYSHTALRHTTVKKLARKLLGDTRRWPALAHFNKLGRQGQIKARTTLVVPFMLEHVINPGETLVDLAKRYYGVERLAGLIALCNSTNDPTPKPGTRIVVPLGTVRITQRKMDQLVRRRLLGLSRTQDTRANEALQESNAMLRRGEYWAVPLRIVSLLAQGQVSESHLAEAYKLLAIAYVAVNHTELARRAFHEVLLRRPGYTLDSITTSPKVIRVLMEAREKMKGK